MKAAALVLLLAAVYLTVIGSVAAGDAAAGLMIGFVITTRLHRLHGGFGAFDWRRAAAVPRLLVGVAREIAAGSLTMLLVLIGRRSWRNVGFVEAPVGDRTPRGTLISALVLSASPGSVLVEVDDRRGIMLVNAIDASDPDALRREIDEFYRNHQKQAVP